jgi:hypothetical protein
MKKTTIALAACLILLVLVPMWTTAQQESGQVNLRVLRIDWYEMSGRGVKIQYRDFSNAPHLLLLPRSLEGKIYRFVEAPRLGGSVQGAPLLLVHMTGTDVRFIDIYTEYQKAGAKIGDFNQDDLAKLKEIEQRGTVDLQF